MGTVSKALGLLDILSRPDTSYGLTEIARLSGHDKATTRRLLLELKVNGFVEQIDGSRDYVLGPALLMLGRVREDRFPFFRIAQPAVSALAEATGETAHASEYSAGSMSSVCSQPSAKSNRVIVRTGEKLPLHATASGLAFLAFCSEAYIDAFLQKPLPRFTAKTLTEPAEIRGLINDTRACGFSQCNQLREDGVHSIAAVILNPKGAPIGSIAVAMPTVRAEPDKLAEYGAMALTAAQEITVRLFGQVTPQKRVA